MAAASMTDTPPVSWSPVVYARTAVADTWWQALPDGAAGTGWLAKTVGAVFAGGAGLDAGPRFLVAQDGDCRIVGVACRARRLSDQMCTDVQGRELSCFVGWMAPLGTAAGPAFTDLEASYVQWAGPVYAEVLGEVWESPSSPFREPAVSQPAAAPWEETVSSGPAVPASRLDGPWPPPAWPAIWTIALATADPFTCVLGWQHAPLTQDADVTLLGTADAPPREVPAPEPEPAPPPPVTELAPPPSVPVPPVPVPVAPPPESVTPPPPVPVPPPSPPPPVPEPLPKGWSRRRKLTVAGAAVIVIAAIAVFLAVRGSSARPPVPRVTVSPSSSGSR